MQLNHPGLSNTFNWLYHVSEEPDIKVFGPRPSPSHFKNIKGDVVFAISGRMLPNYLLPRDCPRVAYYATEKTTVADREKFIGQAAAGHVIIVESGWYQRIKETTLYCYEFLPDGFSLLDECAGYYIADNPVVPVAVKRVNDCIAEMLNHNVELRFTPSLIDIAEEISTSSLNYSLIRMRNAAR